MPRKVYDEAYQGCSSCGEVGCIPGKCRKRAPRPSYRCGKYPRLFEAFGLGCGDPRKCGGGHHSGHPPFHPDDPYSAWSHDGPGSFHPVPTRPVFGPQPTPAGPPQYESSEIETEEGPSDPGVESIPLKDMPRNLDTPTDPRNLLPPPADAEPDATDFPDDAEASSRLKRPTVQRTAWRPRGTSRTQR